MKSFVVSKGEEGQSALKYTQRILKEAPNSFLYKMFRKKNIVLNGKKIEGNEKVKAGDEIKIFLADDTFDKFAGTGDKGPSVEDYKEAYARFGNPEVVYEDEHVLVINKPVDMLSQKAAPKDLSANEWIIGYLLFTKKITQDSLRSFVPSVCNRLDRNTGGLLLFGKTPFGTNILNSCLRDRSIHKYYRTAVSGRVTEKIRVSGYLIKDESSNKVEIYDNNPGGDASYIETEYEPVEYLADKNVTILNVLLVTGKPHQIRAHLSFMGHPILGDHKYGTDSVNNKFGFKYQILYAVSVVFPDIPEYPEISGKTISISEPKIFEKIRN